VNAKTTAPSKPPAKPAPNAKSYSQAKEIEARKAAENETLLKDQAKMLHRMSIPEWHGWFELTTARLMQSSRNTQFINDALASIYRRKPTLPPEVEPFFNFHALLFVLSRLTKQPQDLSGYAYSYLAFHTHHAASDLQGTIEQGILQAASLAVQPANSGIIEQTLAHLRREMLTEANDNHYFLAHYLSVWTHWIRPAVSDTRPYAEELPRLDAVAGEAGSDLSQFAWRIARAGMLLYQGNDPEAWAQLEAAKKISEISSDYLLYYLSYLSQAGQWTRLTEWLIEIAPYLNLRRNANIRPYSEFWELAVDGLPEAEPKMWDALVSMLPHSRALYEEKLLAYGKWERWMDFHLSLDSDPMDFRVTDLAPLEKNAPEMLLPFYHQAVERYVLIKNRDGYKTAVKLLKRLAKLYKKMKQEPRWELFLSSFIFRHSRLRALQEELRKGKLLQ
jgi:hypothetical protein